MLTGTQPFKSHNEKELFRKIQKGAYVLKHPRQQSPETNQQTKQSGDIKANLFDPGQSVQQAEPPKEPPSFSA
jgi:hypothetical protein